MTDYAGHENVGSYQVVAHLPATIRRPHWRKAMVLGAALGGLWTARGVAHWSGEPPTGRVGLWTGLLIVASLAVLAFAISSLVTSLQSPLHHVFCGRRELVFGTTLFVVAAFLAAPVVRSRPFQDVIARGRISLGDIADGGFVLAVIVCLTGSGVALAAARDALRDERNWQDSIGVSLR